MVTTRAGSRAVAKVLPVWGARGKRSIRPKGGRKKVGSKGPTKARVRMGRGSIPAGFKGPCKTHTLDVIKTIHRDGRGSGQLSNIDRGEDLGNREGRRVRVSRMLIRGKLWLDANNSKVPGSNLTKIWFIKDRRPGNEVVAFSSLMDMTDSEPLSAVVKMDYRDRFIVLKDMVVDLHGGDNFRINAIDIDEMIECNCDVLFNHEDQGSLANTLENAIMIYYACSDSVHQTQITAQCRLYFFDSVSN
uniref:Capsid protein n=1 Tax=Paper mulberry leaf curling associated virus 2 TaxID=2738470 RepID=A0A6M6DIK2_9GEMI|nr:V1 [Paper mulberry leaf curling associated virus 2]